jgi:hypothetical protein
VEHIYRSRQSSGAKATATGKTECRGRFWLPNQKVKNGDLIVLYTKKGTHSEKKNPGGSVSYFYYWNQTDPIWLEGRFAVLLEIQSWDNFEIVPEDLSEEPLSKGTLPSLKPPNE